MEEYNPIGNAKNALSSTTGVYSIEDVYFSQTEDTLTLRFGYNEFEFDKTVLVTEEMRNNLKRLDITMEIRTKGSKMIDIYFKGEEVKEVANS